MYKSVLHRAVVNSSSQRLSLACFLNPPLNATVAAPPELITPEWPQIYRPFTWLEYLKNAYLYHPITGADRHERFFLSTAASSWLRPVTRAHRPRRPEFRDSATKTSARAPSSRSGTSSATSATSSATYATLGWTNTRTVCSRIRTYVRFGNLYTYIH